MKNNGDEQMRKIKYIIILTTLLFVIGANVILKFKFVNLRNNIENIIQTENNNVTEYVTEIESETDECKISTMDIESIIDTPTDKIGKQIIYETNKKLVRKSEIENKINELEISITNERIFNGYNVKSIKYFIDFGPIKTDHGRYSLSLDINYPQIGGVTNKDVENKINNILKMVVIENDNGDKNYSEILEYYKSIIEMKGNVNYLTDEVKNEYKVMSLNDKYISVYFKGEMSDGNKVDFFDYFVTIDLGTGNFIYLKDIADIEKIKENIKKGNYEVISGVSETGFEAINKQTQMREFPDAFYYSTMIYDFEYFAELMNLKTVYKRYNYNNFCIDDKYLYIKFLYEYAIDGEVILKLNKDDCGIEF